MPTYRGVGCHCGAGSTSSTSITGQIQTRDFELNADKEEIKNGNGEVVGVVYYNPNSKATFSFIPTSSTLNGDLTFSLPAIGTLVTLTDTKFTQIAGTNWIVEKSSAKSANNGATRVDIELMQYSGVAS